MHHCPTCGDLLTTFLGGYQHCHTCGTLCPPDGSLPVVPMIQQVMEQNLGKCLRSDHDTLCMVYLAAMDTAKRQRLLADKGNGQ